MNCDVTHKYDKELSESKQLDPISPIEQITGEVQVYNDQTLLPRIMTSEPVKEYIKV